MKNFITITLLSFTVLAAQPPRSQNKDLKYEMVDFHSDRPGHDLRYGLDGSKLFNMGFKLPLNFEESLEKTVKWTLENQKWLEKWNWKKNIYE